MELNKYVSIYMTEYNRARPRSESRRQLQRRTCAAGYEKACLETVAHTIALVARDQSFCPGCLSKPSVKAHKHKHTRSPVRRPLVALRKKVRVLCASSDLVS